MTVVAGAECAASSHIRDVRSPGVLPRGPPWVVPAHSRPVAQPVIAAAMSALRRA